ncbi:MAG: hypothetical protein C4337_01040, partial [Armatimonadota bacterium]
MNLTLMVKLMPTEEQHTALLETMERFNAACNAIAEVPQSVGARHAVPLLSAPSARLQRRTS